MAAYGFIENIDFRSLSEISEKPQGGRPTTDYEITIDMAKEYSFTENLDYRMVCTKMYDQ